MLNPTRTRRIRDELALRHLPPPPAPKPAARPVAPEAQATFLEECAAVGLDPNDSNTPTELERLQWEAVCAAHGLDPDSPTVEADLQRIFAERLR